MNGRQSETAHDSRDPHDPSTEPSMSSVAEFRGCSRDHWWQGRAQSITILCLTLCLATRVLGGEENTDAVIHPDFVMDADPRLEDLPKPVLVFPARCKELWLESLARPEADLQRLAASTIVTAHAKGMAGLIEAEPLLVKIIASEGTHRASRFAAARALIALDARNAATALFEASQRYGGELRQLVEPALAHWNFQPIHSVWQDRLESQSPRHRELMLAIRGLAVAEDESSTQKLVAIVHDRLQLPATRIAAARAAGRISRTGLEPQAARLLELPAFPIPHRVCAVALLDRHQSSAAQALLTRLAQDSEPSVAAAALRCLNTIDPDLVLTLAEQAIENNDPQVRAQGADAYVSRPTPQRAVFVARLLDDPHPAVRGKVRDQLFRLTQIPDCNTPIREAALAMLTNASWRGQEQAALLLGALDHKPAAHAMVTLLESPRGEVMVAAAWGLRKLAVADTLPAIFDKAIRQTELRRRAPWGTELDLQVAHLIEALAVQNYAAAEPLWRRYIPKELTMGEKSRGAAIWALGRLYVGKADDTLSKLFVERLTDPAPPPLEPAEMMRVRVMCAVALGRMGAVSQADRMRRYSYLGTKVTLRPSSLAIRWALRELTGEVLPEPEPARLLQSGWFLEPLDDQEPEQN
jgi:hypothetical protein